MSHAHPLRGALFLLGGLLMLEGVAIIVLGGSLVGIGNSGFPNEVYLYNIFWGTFSPVVGWILLVVLVGAAGGGLWLQDARKRRRGLETAPRSLVALKIALIAVAVGVLGFQGQYLSSFGPMFAGLSIATIPVLILYLIFHRYITKGIALGGAFR